ncbi:putative single-stranded DNA-binding protein [Sinorhizobium phage phiM9]|uniref:Single-stranded DNA-binding protein n=1 Tax=Sinorhizobium phage phiM9 TaxID=1636182 RepID=A0A0F6R5S5_9CAUD|nr:putative single-stranded DNA-binding protein [Sinorhizobium phage phiM9]AKE44685.1 putative single-stranded DNA-binding protein [Sinorhizobium phage phiM9]
MAFSDLKKKAADIEAVRSRVTQNQGGGEGNGEFLQMGIDNTRNGYLRVRLMPAPEGEDAPMVTYSRFYWKNGAKAYSAYSLKNLGQQDPCQQYLSQLWDDGSEASKKLYRERKKKTTTVVNVTVLEDKVKPENNGFVGKMRVVGTIKDMIDKALNPKEDKFTGEKPESFNPFDIFGHAGGRDLIIRIVDKDGNNNYDESKWADKSTPLFGGDEAKMEEAWKKCKPLQTYFEPSKYKTYDELARILVEVVGRNDPFIRAALGDWLESNESPAQKQEAADRAEQRKTEEKREEKTETKSEEKKTEKSETPKEEKKTETKSEKEDDGFDFDFDVGDDPFSA